MSESNSPGSIDPMDGLSDFLAGTDQEWHEKLKQMFTAEELRNASICETVCETGKPSAGTEPGNPNTAQETKSHKRSAVKKGKLKFCNPPMPSSARLREMLAICEHEGGVQTKTRDQLRDEHNTDSNNVLQVIKALFIEYYGQKAFYEHWLRNGQRLGIAPQPPVSYRKRGEPMTEDEERHLALYQARISKVRQARRPMRETKVIRGRSAGRSQMEDMQHVSDEPRNRSALRDQQTLATQRGRSGMNSRASHQGSGSRNVVARGHSSAPGICDRTLCCDSTQGRRTDGSRGAIGNGISRSQPRHDSSLHVNAQGGVLSESDRLEEVGWTAPPGYRQAQQACGGRSEPDFDSRMRSTTQNLAPEDEQRIALTLLEGMRDEVGDC